MSEYYMEKYYPSGLKPKDMIQKLIDKHGYQSYLEIGVAWGETFDGVRAKYKVGVDPDPNSKATQVMPSDEFFKNLDPHYKFDIIFVDGLHQWEQCYRDIENSLNHLSPDGTILVHDVNPLEEVWVTDVPREGFTPIWTGDVYKAIVKARIDRNDIQVCTLYDLWFGVGVIRKGIGVPIKWDFDNLDYGVWVDNKDYLMNPIKTSEFIEKML